MERVVSLEDIDGGQSVTTREFRTLAENTQGAFKETELGPLPDNWAVSSIADSCYRPEYGYTVSAQKEPVGPRLLRITDIQGGAVDWETVPYCRCDEDTKQRHRLQPGDLLFARIGATTGKSFLVRSCPEAVYASYLIRIRAKAVDPDFLYYFCNSEMYWKQINANKGDKLKGGVSGSVLAQVRHCLPPLPEHREIAAVLSKIQKAVEVQEKIVATLWN
jgi:restriction endonuclease S subunit